MNIVDHIPRICTFVGMLSIVGEWESGHAKLEARMAL